MPTVERKAFMKRASLMISVFILNASSCGGFAPSCVGVQGSSRTRRPFVSTPFVPCIQQIHRLPSTMAHCQNECFLQGRIHTHVQASSYGDEGEYLYGDVQDENSIFVSPHDEESVGRKGRLRRIGKRIAVISAVGLSVFGSRYARFASASFLAVAFALKLSKGMKPRQSDKDREGKEQTTSTPAKRDTANGWLEATMSNLDRMGYAVEEEKRMEIERREEERIARGKEWAKQSLQTTEELCRKAEEARREEERARKWADAMIQKDIKRQKESDIERFGN